MKSIAALLSGGVDSSVALAKFIHDNPKYKSHITIYYLKIWLEDEVSYLGSCPWEEDLDYVTKIATQFDIPMNIIPLQHEYYDTVVSYTIQELKQGGTPSPDVFCNQYIKFGAFLNRVQDVDLIISGHYAKNNRDITHNTARLYQPLDTFKDQTYFLSHLSKEQLLRIEFPLHNIIKQDVRIFAQEHQLATYKRKDSQGICFLGNIKYRDFVEYHLGKKQGSIIDKHSGKILGTHDGTWFYTIGQRTGLKLGGGPWYVVSKSFDENIVWVQHDSLMSTEYVSEFAVSNVHWIDYELCLAHVEFQHHASEYLFTNLQVKIRHGQEMYTATMKYTPRTNSGIIHLEQGDTGIADGQIAVLYYDHECLGCARIQSITTTPHE